MHPKKPVVTSLFCPLVLLRCAIGWGSLPNTIAKAHNFFVIGLPELTCLTGLAGADDDFFLGGDDCGLFDERGASEAKAIEDAEFG